MTHQDDTLKAGFVVVVDPEYSVIHKTDSDCWDEGKVHYIPFHTVEEAKSQGNEPCSSCLGSYSSEPPPSTLRKANIPSREKGE